MNRLTRLAIIFLTLLLLAAQAQAGLRINIISPNEQYINRARLNSVRLYASSDDPSLFVGQIQVCTTRTSIIPPDEAIYTGIRTYYPTPSSTPPYTWGGFVPDHTYGSSSVYYFNATHDSPGSTNWTWNIPADNYYINGARYTIYSRNIGDWSTITLGDSFSFTYDNAAPSVPSFAAITSPAKSVTAPVSVSVSDQHTGVKYLKAFVYYTEGTSNYYYNNVTGTWVPYSVYLPMYENLTTPAPGAIVTSDFTFPALISGKTYYYGFRAVDLAGNYVESTPRSFYYDNVAPTLTVTLPDSSSTNYCTFTGTGADAKYNGVVWDRKITGTATDPTTGSGLNKVELQIIRNRAGSNYYFNGTSWVSSATTVRATISSPNFYYLLPSGFFSGVAHGDIITINATAYDSANNSSSVTGRIFKIDTQKPASSITTGGDSGLISTYPSSLIGTSSDNLSGTESVKLTIKRTRGTEIKYWGQTVVGIGINPLTGATYPIYGYGWIASDSSAAATVTGTSTLRNWSLSAGTMFSDAQIDDTYTITAQSTDRAGNQESPGIVKTLRRNPTLPFVSVTSPTSHFKATNKPTAVNVTASDDSGITSVKVRIKRHGMSYDWVTGRWEVTSANLYKTATNLGGTSYQVSLPTNFYDDLSDGHEFTFYVEAQNGASGTTYLTTDPIFYDNTQPLPPAALRTEIKWQNNPNGRIDQGIDYNDGSDPLPPTRLSASGLSHYSINVKNQLWETVATDSIPPSASYTWTMPAEGPYTIRMSSIDNATNTSSQAGEILFGYDATPPEDFAITNPSSGSTINTTTPTIIWTAASDLNPSGFLSSGIDHYDIYLDGAASPVATTSDISKSLPPGSLTNGAHTLSVVAVDKAGNTREKISSFTVRTRVAPAITLSSPADGSMVNTATINLTGSVIDDSLVNTVTLTVNGSTSTIYSGASANVTLNQPISLMAGNNTINLRAVDDTGDTTETTLTVFCDTDNPASFNVTYPAKDGWAVAKPTFKWEKSSDSASGLLGYDLYVDSVKVNEHAIEGESFEYPSTLSDNSHTYKVIAWDKAGNYYDTGIINFNVDSVAPSAPALSLPLNGQIMTSNFKVAWSPSTDIRSGLDRYEVYVGETKIGATSDTSLWTTTLPEDGAHEVKVVAYDKAGNISISNKVSVVINVNPPTVSLLVNNQSIANDDRINTLPKIKAEIRDASGVDPSSIKILVDGVVQTTSNLQALSAIDGSVTSYNASKDDLRLSAGKHTIKVEAKDLQGKTTVREFTNLEVSGKTEITGFVMNYPNPFKPSTAGTTINYTLVDDASLKIMIYDLSGRLINKIDCLEGTEGGRFGENNVPWDGKTFIGDNLANGAYVYLIVDSKNNIVGSGEMAVYE